MTSKSAIKDAVHWFSEATRLREPVVRLLSAVQNLRPDIQIMALATALVLICQALRLDTHDIIEKSRRAIRDADGPYAPQIAAMRTYATESLRVE
jgi:hypothetical protein